jgi:hypothetical protein
LGDQRNALGDVLRQTHDQDGKCHQKAAADQSDHEAEREIVKVHPGRSAL